MVCSNDKLDRHGRPLGVHSALCDIDYPYRRYADSNDVLASHPRDCTLARTFVKSRDVNLRLGFEANMTLVSRDELASMDDQTRFGTYCDLKLGKRIPADAHFCVDAGRRTVDGRRLAWLWVFPDGRPRRAHKVLEDPPSLVWTKAEILAAWDSANNPTLATFTRHVDTFSELAITFCLPLPPP